MKTNRMEVSVHWGDCDPAVIVFYPQYFRWFDCATTELFGSVGLDLSTLFRDHGVVGIPILDARAQFRRPSRFRDLLAVESGIAEWRSSSFRVEHRVFNKGELAVEGYELRAWVAPDETRPAGIRALPVPAEVRSRFEEEGPRTRSHGDD